MIKPTSCFCPFKFFTWGKGLRGIIMFDLLLFSQLVLLISQLLSPMVLLPRLFRGIGVIVRPCTLLGNSAFVTVNHFQVNDLFLTKRCLGKWKMRRVFALRDGVHNMEMISDKWALILWRSFVRISDHFFGLSDIVPLTLALLNLPKGKV